ncbi:unnamed protein product [Protopolystoma xenopodis]|uniref:Uncharacterized protein n=1 Tax=Protopolystoma xenopodis TaxID=117903 RepID=A0A448XI22_9PLAT|nr:unnamed protein product [Protopolystoma xenopodis]
MSSSRRPTGWSTTSSWRRRAIAAMQVTIVYSAQDHLYRTRLYRCLTDALLRRTTALAERHTCRPYPCPQAQVVAASPRPSAAGHVTEAPGPRRLNHPVGLVAL